MRRILSILFIAAIALPVAANAGQKRQERKQAEEQALQEFNLMFQKVVPQQSWFELYPEQVVVNDSGKRKKKKPLGTTYEIYENALNLLDENKYDQAKKLFLYLILEVREQERLEMRTVGMEFIEYLPYYFLGATYEKMGDKISAQNYFALSYKAGAVREDRSKMDHINDFFGFAYQSAPTASSTEQ